MCPPGVYVPRSLHQKGSKLLSARTQTGKTDFKDTERVTFDQLVVFQIQPFQAGMTALAVKIWKGSRRSLQGSSNGAGH